MVVSTRYICAPNESEVNAILAHNKQLDLRCYCDLISASKSIDFIYIVRKRLFAIIYCGCRRDALIGGQILRYCHAPSCSTDTHARLPRMCLMNQRIALYLWPRYNRVWWRRSGTVDRQTLDRSERSTPFWPRARRQRPAASGHTIGLFPPRLACVCTSTHPC